MPVSSSLSCGELVVDRVQLVVQRPQFFVGGLHFLRGRLQLLVDALQFGLQLLVGRAELFVRRFLVFEDRPRVLSHLAQFPLQLRASRGRIIYAVGRGNRLRAWRLLAYRRLVMKQHEEGGLAGWGFDGYDIEAHGGHLAVAKDADPAPMNGSRALLRVSQSTAQLAGQPLAGHAKKIEAHAARSWFEVGAGSTAEPPYLQVGINDHSHRGVAIQHDPVRFSGGIEVHR